MRRTAALLIASAALTCVAGPALAAPDNPVTGYWSRTRPALPVPVAPADPAPEGGMWVAADPSGPIAVSALRTDLPAGLVAVELRLPIADALGTPSVQVCPSVDRWAAEQGGRLEGAPAADCSDPLTATVDGEVLVVPLRPGLGTVNVVLRPTPGSAFSLTMGRASAASVVTAAGPGSSPDAPAPSPAAAAPGSAGAASAPLFPPLIGQPTDVAAPAQLTGRAVPAPAISTPAPAPGVAPQPAAPLVSARAAIEASDRTQELVALGVLLLVGLQAFLLARQPAAAPRALGGSARRSRPAALPTAPSQSAARGLGRFRADRSRPPLRL